MIELFDAARLCPRRDHSLQLATGALALGVLGLGVYAGHLDQALRSEQARKTALEGELRQAQRRVQAAPSAALIADLKRELTAAEAEGELAAGAAAAASSARLGTVEAAETAPRDALALQPSAWLERLAALGNAELSLSKVEIDAQGRTSIEGVAAHAHAVSAFVQAFSRQEAIAGLAPSAVELREDKTSAPYLRFQMRATLPAREQRALKWVAADAGGRP